MRTSRLTKLTALLILLALPACQTLRELTALSADITGQFGAKANVNLRNDAHLEVVLENAKEAALPEAEREKFARSVAEYVRDNYSRFDQLEDVSVSLETVGRAGPATAARSSTYLFTKEDLEEAPEDTSGLEP